MGDEYILLLKENDLRKRKPSALPYILYNKVSFVYHSIKYVQTFAFEHNQYSIKRFYRVEYFILCNFAIVKTATPTTKSNKHCLLKKSQS